MMKRNYLAQLLLRLFPQSAPRIYQQALCQRVAKAGRESGTDNVHYISDPVRLGRFTQSDLGVTDVCTPSLRHSHSSDTCAAAFTRRLVPYARNSYLNRK